MNELQQLRSKKMRWHHGPRLPPPLLPRPRAQLHASPRRRCHHQRRHHWRRCGVRAGVHLRRCSRAWQQRWHRPGHRARHAGRGGARRNRLHGPDRPTTRHSARPRSDPAGRRPLPAADEVGCASGSRRLGWARNSHRLTSLDVSHWSWQRRSRPPAAAGPESTRACVWLCRGRRSRCLSHLRSVGVQLIVCWSGGRCCHGLGRRAQLPQTPPCRRRPLRPSHGPAHTQGSGWTNRRRE